MESTFVPRILFCLFGAACLAAPTAGVSAVDSEAVARRAFGGIQPRVSPDGKRVALSYQGAICTMPSEGGKLMRLTRGTGWDIDPEWSPDGARLAYVNAPNSSSGALRLIHAAAGEPEKLKTSVRAQGPLFFHPDGTRILGLFSGSDPALRLGWYHVASEEVTLLDGIGPADPAEFQRKRIAYALSRDGAWILFALHADLPDEQGGNNGPASTLWRVPSGGGESPAKVVQFPARIYNLCWNADDTGCYLVTDLGTSHYDVWHLPLADGLRDATKITSGQADEDWPSLSGDGRSLVYTENARGATAIIRHDLATDTPVALSLDGIDFGEPTGTLRLTIMDQESGEPVTARISLRRKDGKFHSPVGSLYRITGGMGHFYGDETTLNLPSGTYELVVMRGLEYRVARREFEINGGGPVAIEVTMNRWSNLQRDGWYSGENHVHANYGYGAWYNTPETILRQCQGEDLNVCNVVVANSDGDGVFDREFFTGEPDDRSTFDTILYWNQEFRSTLWGHMTLSNLSQLVEPVFTGFLQTTNPWDVPTNADIAQATIDARGTVSYTHPAANFLDLYDQPYAAKGLPVDAALGRVQTMDVMGNTYRGSVLFWYRLLNCGFRIAASAGTDCFLNRIQSYPPGWGRAYVHMAGALTYADWVEGQRDGRAFVTNGPMLALTVDGKSLGDTVALSASREVAIRGTARSQFPIEKLELVYNGGVVATGTIANDKKSGTLEGAILLDKTGWVALRCEGPPAPYVVRQGLYAHTNPVYVQLEGHVPGAAEEAAYFLRWIDRLEADFERRDRIPTDAARRHVTRQFEAARKIYREIKARQPNPPKP